MPNLSSTPARITDPAVGASVWASGSQVWSGKIGTFTAKARAKDRNTHRAVVVSRLWASARVTRSKVRSPPVASACRKARVRMPTSMRAEPAIVYRKNLVAA